MPNDQVPFIAHCDSSPGLLDRQYNGLAGGQRNWSLPMAIFAYEAMNSSGQEVKDEIDATSPEEAVAKIRGKGYFPTKVREKASKKRVQKKETGVVETK